VSAGIISGAQDPFTPGQLVDENGKETHDVESSQSREFLLCQGEAHDRKDPSKAEYRRRNIGCEDKKKQQEMSDLIGASLVKEQKRPNQQLQKYVPPRHDNCR